MIKKITPAASWLISLWTAYVFIGSLPYKFTMAPDTQHIFGTIGAWMSDTINQGLGEWFASQGAYWVGSAELITSIVLLLPIVLLGLSKISSIKPPCRPAWHCLGGLMSAGIMTGAVFFHLFTPLGIEVLHNGKSDGGSLFMAAVSILILGGLMFLANLYIIYDSRK